jgi:enoyl-CoA hydratase/carnithine racemase
MPRVLVERQSPQTSVVTLNRPERHNALTIELMAELQYVSRPMPKARFHTSVVQV